MIPFDLSSNIVLITVIAVILIIYAIVLVKLRPSEEAEPSINRYAEIKKAPIEPKRPEKPTKANETQEITDEEPMRVSPSTPKDENQKTPEHVASVANQSSNSYCSHHFGYLRKLPKGTPIPSRCLRCPQVVECLTALEIEQKLVKGRVTKS